MKRLLVLLLLVMALAAQAGTVVRALSAVEAIGASTPIDTSNTKAVRVQVFSDATSVATVVIEQSSNGGTWYTVATVTNPSSTGELWSVAPSVAFTRVRVSEWTSGKITADCEYQR